MISLSEISYDTFITKTNLIKSDASKWLYDLYLYYQRQYDEQEKVIEEGKNNNERIIGID